MQEKIARQDFKGKDFSNEAIADRLYEKCNFAGAVLECAELDDVTFVSCDLTATNFKGARIGRVHFDGCKLVGIDFHECTGFLNLSFSKCVLESCNFSNLKLRRTPFKESEIRRCIFVRTDLVEADFADSDLSDSVFQQTDLTKANFIGAYNYAIDPRANTLAKARFNLPQAASLLRGLDIIIE